ncbi:MAG: transcription antitermination factor NusB [Flavobacteriales bacterium]|jgi:N utilization substance protein B|nr:transcription antitermination factor NusB [Flavobacteriales bacterium]
MLNRRQVRRKVMHQLYAFHQQGSAESNHQDQIVSFDKKLVKSFDDFYSLFLVQINVLMRIKNEAEEKLEIEKNKYSPDRNDLYRWNKIINNQILQKLSGNIILLDKIGKLSFSVDQENVQLIESLAKKFFDQKLDFKGEENLFEKDKMEVLEFFNNHIAENEEMHQAYLVSNLNWVDDMPLANTMSYKFLKSFKEKDDEYKQLPKSVSDKDTIHFGRQLFIKSVNRWSSLNGLIEKHLKNWELDRLAFMDLMIMKMAITEYYEFEDIPLRVSMNEYIELAKDYSGPKSAVFINGVLDKTQKYLVESKELPLGKIQ